MLKNELDVTLHRAENLKEKPDQTQLGFGNYFTDHMFTMRWNKEQGWHDARIEPYGNFSLDPAAMVLHYSQEIFEGLKAYRNADDSVLLFRPMDNLNRFNDSAERMCMPRIPTDEVLQAMKGLIYLERDWIPQSQGAALYIRPAMIATEAALGVRPADEYIFFIICSPVGAYYAEGFSPTRIYVEDKYVRAVQGGVGNVKTGGNYAASIKAHTTSQQKGYTQGEDRTLVDAFITWQSPSDAWGLTLYGKNLTNEIWRSTGQAVATLWNFTHHGPPREIGVVARYNF